MDLINAREGLRGEAVRALATSAHSTVMHVAKDALKCIAQLVQIVTSLAKYHSSQMGAVPSTVATVLATISQKEANDQVIARHVSFIEAKTAPLTVLSAVILLRALLLLQR